MRSSSRLIPSLLLACGVALCAAQQTCPQPFTSPSLEKPFFFFHMPKCAGSSVRKIFCRAGVNSVRLIPGCHGISPHWQHPLNTSCPFGALTEPMACKYPAHTACAAIFAGHIGTSLTRAIRVKTPDLPCQRALDQKHDYTCMVMFRDPISRILSHYYHFMRDKARRTPFVSLSVAEQRNVALRSGANLTLHYLGGVSPVMRDDVDIEKGERGLEYRSLSATIETIDKCVIGLVEDWKSSVRIMTHFLPWAQNRGGQGLKNIHENKRKKVKYISANDLSEASRHALSDVLATEIKLYERAKVRFEFLLKCANPHR